MTCFSTVHRYAAVSASAVASATFSVLSFVLFVLSVFASALCVVTVSDLCHCVSCFLSTFNWFFFFQFSGMCFYIVAFFSLFCHVHNTQSDIYADMCFLNLVRNVPPGKGMKRRIKNLITLYPLYFEFFQKQHDETTWRMRLTTFFYPDTDVLRAELSHLVAVDFPKLPDPVNDDNLTLSEDQLDKIQEVFLQFGSPDDKWSSVDLFKFCGDFFSTDANVGSLPLKKYRHQLNALGKLSSDYTSISLTGWFVFILCVIYVNNKEKKMRAAWDKKHSQSDCHGGVRMVPKNSDGQFCLDTECCIPSNTLLVAKTWIILCKARIAVHLVRLSVRYGTTWWTDCVVKICDTVGMEGTLTKRFVDLFRKEEVHLDPDLEDWANNDVACPYEPINALSGVPMSLKAGSLHTVPLTAAPTEMPSIIDTASSEPPSIAPSEASVPPSEHTSYTGHTLPDIDAEFQSGVDYMWLLRSVLKEESVKSFKMTLKILVLIASGLALFNSGLTFDGALTAIANFDFTSYLSSASFSGVARGSIDLMDKLITAQQTGNLLIFFGLDPVGSALDKDARWYSTVKHADLAGGVPARDGLPTPSGNDMFYVHEFLSWGNDLAIRIDAHIGVEEFKIGSHNTIKYWKNLRDDVRRKIVSVAQIANSLGSRVKPMTIMLVGRSSVGKTTVTDMVLAVMCSALKLPRQASYRYYLNDSLKHWDGFHVMAHTLIWDDASCTALIKGMSSFLDVFLSVVGNQPFTTPQAEIGNKAVCKANPRLMVITSNSLDLQASKVMNAPEAVLRRIDLIVEQVVRPEHTVKGMLGNFATDPKSTSEMDYWEFNVYKATLEGLPARTDSMALKNSANAKTITYDAVSLETVATGLGVNDFCKLVYSETLKQDAAQASVMSVAKNISEAVYNPETGDLVFQSGDPKKFDLMNYPVFYAPVCGAFLYYLSPVVLKYVFLVISLVPWWLSLSTLVGLVFQLSWNEEGLFGCKFPPYDVVVVRCIDLKRDIIFHCLNNNWRPHIKRIFNAFITYPVLTFTLISVLVFFIFPFFINGIFWIASFVHPLIACPIIVGMVFQFSSLDKSLDIFRAYVRLKVTTGPLTQSAEEIAECVDKFNRESDYPWYHPYRLYFRVKNLTLQKPDTTLITLSLVATIATYLLVSDRALHATTQVSGEDTDTSPAARWSLWSNFTDMTHTSRSVANPEAVITGLSSHVKRIVFQNKRWTNSLHIKSVDNGVLVVTTLHSFQEYIDDGKDSITFQILDSGLSIGASKGGVITANTTVSIKKSELFKIEDRDLLFFVAQTYRVTDISKYFCGKEHRANSNTPAYILSKDVNGDELTHVSQFCHYYTSAINVTNRATGEVTRSAGERFTGLFLPATSGGACGAPMVQTNGKQVAIVGLHQLGDTFQKSYSTKITREDIALALEHLLVADGIETMELQHSGQTFDLGKIFRDFNQDIARIDKVEDEFEPLHPRSVFNQEQNPDSDISGTLKVLGSLKDSARPLSSKVYEHPLKEQLLAATGLPHGNKVPPPHLRRDTWYRARRHFVEAVCKIMRNIPLKIVTLALYGYLIDVFSRLYHPSMDGVAPITVEQSINGMDGSNDLHKYMGKLVMNTSAGYPYNKPKKELLLNPNAEKKTFIKPIMDQIERIRNAFIRGVMPSAYDVMFSAFIKDEPISEVKRDASKVRVVIAGPVAFLILFRQYYLPIIAFMAANRIAFEACPSTVVQSAEWSLQREFIVQNGLNPKFFDGDYKGWDASLQKAFVVCFFKMAYCIAFMSGNYTREDLQVMAGISIAVTDSTVNFFGDVISFCGFMPSGQPATAQTNCVGGSVMIRIAWILAGFRICDFRKHVRLLTYGDDNWGSIDSDNTTFSKVDIAERLAPYGINYTNADKSLTITPYSELDSIEFLKRSWKWEPRVNAHLAPLSISTLGNMCCNIKSSPYATEHDQIVSGFVSLVTEAFYHGEEMYVKIQSALRKVADENRLVLHNVISTSYEEKCDIFVDDSQFFLDNCDRIIMCLSK